MDEVDRFITEGNISLFTDQLRYETSPSRRERLKRLLIEQENRLGTAEDRLRMVERKLTEGTERIVRQRRLIAEIKGGAGGDAGEAERALEHFEMTQDLFESLRALYHDERKQRLP